MILRITLGTQRKKKGRQEEIKRQEGNVKREEENVEKDRKSYEHWKHQCKIRIDPDACKKAKMKRLEYKASKKRLKDEQERLAKIKGS